MSDQNHVIPVTAATIPASQLREMVEHNAKFSALDESGDFPAGIARFVNNRALTGVPFIVVSPWLERREDAKVFPSGKQYPAHQVMQMMVRTLNPETYEAYDPEQATLSGEYLLNQLRNATEQEILNGGPWTLRYHPHLTLAKFGKPELRPLMLARYNPARDVPPIEFDGASDDGWKDPGINYMGEPTGPRQSKGLATAPNGMPEAINLYPLQQMLDSRSMTPDDFLTMTGWDSITGHTPQQFTAAFTLIDKVRALESVKSVKDLQDESARVSSRTRK